MSTDLIYALGAMGYAATLNPRNDVSYIRPELIRMMPRYKRIRDCLSGDYEIKLARTIYLPMPNPTDKSPENLARYESYLKRAIFYSVLKQTSQGLVGQCQLNKPILKLSKAIEGLEFNIDGLGDIFQFGNKSLATNVNFGRGAIFTDFPEFTGKQSSVFDNEMQMPSCTLYQPENITDWRYKYVNGREVLKMVVLREFFDTEIEEFAMNTSVRWRQLYLDNDGFYAVQLWKLAETKGNQTGIINTNGEIIKDGPVMYPMANKKRLDFIPIEAIGAETNTLDDVCVPQMDSIAAMNIGHFCNSADYEESLFQNGQGTIVVTGITKSWWKDVLHGILRLGAMGSIPLEKGSDAKILQLNPNSMPIEGMRHKEEQMTSLGAKLIKPSTIVKTATETTVNKADENSILTRAAKNTSTAVTNSLKNAHFFATGERESEEYKAINFQILTESAVSNMTVQEQFQMVDNWVKGAVTDKEMRSKFREAVIAFDDSWKRPEMITQSLMGAPAPSGTVNTVTGQNLSGNNNNN